MNNAEIQLRDFESGANKVGSALNRMVDQFSGRKLIQEATMMSRVLGDSGSIARLTGNELQTAGAKATEAIEKMKRLGVDVPPGLQRIADAAGGGTNAFGTFGTALGTVDKTLGAFGVHIGPEVQALNEMGSAVGKTASQLGMLGVAGLAVGAGIGGWKIGRAMAEFFDLDHAIGTVTAKLLGFGDVAAQEAGAKTDALARASKLAGQEIKDMGLALAINEEAAKKFSDSFNTSAIRVAGWQAEIAKVRAAGSLAALTKDLASQNSTVDELSKQYDISVRAIQFFQRETKAADDAILTSNKRKLEALGTEIAARKEAAAAEKRTADLEAATLLGVTRLWDEYYALRISHGGTANAAAIADIQRWAADTEAAAKKAGTATSAFHAALAADSHEKMAAVGIDWDLWRTKSIPALQEAAENARRTYNEMVASGLFFREDLEKQYQKWQQLTEAARGYGDTAKAAHDKAADAAKKHTEELALQAEKLKRIQEIMAMGGSTELRDLTKQQFTEAGGLNRIAMLEDYTKQSYGSTWESYLARQRDLVLLAELQKYVASLPHMQSGGPVLRDGPIYAHAGEYVMPKGGGAGQVINTFYVNGAAEDVARKIASIIQRSIMQGAKIGSS